MRDSYLGPVVLAAAALAAAAAPSRAEAPKAQTTLAELAWLEGRWVGGEGSDLSEETWVAPAGDSMLGMWRYVASGKTRIFEILTITAEESGLVLRIRHFDPRLVAREDKERAVELPLVSSGPREAAFEGPEYSGKGTVRLSYRRPSDDTLVCVLEKEAKKQEFTFRRK